ncbi:MAG: hypothetical protein LBD99_03355 [Candidatus Margulisbacteria bacterium]|jgi:hypothetical protein|nr:hypothetical protein [Candidatus Margulisiibacteriota bacterium]
MRRLFICLFVLLALSAAAGSILPERLKGTVTHILEDFSSANPHRLVKVRTAKSKDFILIEMPADRRLNVGDRILIQKIDENYNYGLDSAFEEKFSFADYARDSAVWLPLAVFGLLALLLLNRPTSLYAAGLLLNGFLLGWLLPLWLEKQLALSLFTLLFYLLNTGLAYFLLPAAKFLPAALSASAGSALSGGLYAILCGACRLTPFEQPGLPSFFNFPPQTDAVVLCVLSFYFCLFALILIAKISWRRSVLANIRLFFFQSLYLFAFLNAGLLLPYILFFQLNNLSLFTLFNYPPFVYPAVKLLFCLLAVNSGCWFYAVYCYVQHRQNFDRYATLRAMKTAPADKLLNLQQILQEHRGAGKSQKRNS